VIRALEHLRLAPPRLLDRRRLRFQKASSNLDLLSPLGVLARGYGIVSRKDGAIVRESGQVNAGDDVSVRLHKGALQCRVTRTSNS
jgi:exodeoxyribonuclease VII large subunit